jgi:hypothetical protein
MQEQLLRSEDHFSSWSELKEELVLSRGTVEQEQCDAGAAHLTHKFSPTYISSAGKICSNTTQISSPKSKPNISKNGWGD